MDLALKQVNSLPAPTWLHLGVNDTQLTESIPEIGPYSGKESDSVIPGGVEVLNEPPALPEIETGMGAGAAAFAEEHRNCGAALRVPAGRKIEAPAVLSYRLDASNPAVADVNTVVAEEDSEITVVMDYSARESVSGFHGGLTRLYAKKGAVIHLVQVQRLNDVCTHFDNIGALAEEGARITVVQAELGGKNALAGCQALLQGKGSSLAIDSIYFGDRNRSIDINYTSRHAGPKTKTEIHVNGALLDESRKTFRGVIDFLKGAARAVGHESEYTLLFSPKVRNLTAPLILCAEEDVEGQHAAATGRVDENRLFYLMSRGLDELAAKKLIIEAQFRPVTDQIPVPALQGAVLDYVKERLGTIESIS